ncbi:MAG: ferrous iron transport protein A [Coriobacteriales bacterium]|nr:ferrous iron transport protein A [Coriobacteriales bacterium]
MPLSLARIGVENSIKKVGGKEETRKFLSKLGFVPGTQVTVVAENSGNIIVSVMESRVAISREMATRIMI